MEELSFKLEIFEGPLDLMLMLIAKHKLNIRDIEISVLLEQFLLYLDKMQEADIEIAGEFMEMAARLIYIKTAALLPKHEVEELKKELEGTLIEYAMCKAAAERLRRRFCGADIFVRDQADIPIDSTYKLLHSPYELYDSLTRLTGKEKFLVKDRPLTLKTMVAHSYVSVFSKILYVLRRIKHGGNMEVDKLYRGQTRGEQVATFLALLELSKYGHISFSEDNRYLEFSGRQNRREPLPQ